MTTQPPAGMLAALMGGGPLPLPKLPCAVCLVHEREPRTAATVHTGTLVCREHARELEENRDDAAALVRAQLEDYATTSELF